MKVLRSICLLFTTFTFLLVFSCSSSSLTNNNSNLNNTNSNTNKDVKKTCDDGQSCSSCLEISGCHWTGNQCASDCISETTCIGPNSLSATKCP